MEWFWNLFKRGNNQNNPKESGKELGLNDATMRLNMLQGSNATTYDEGDGSQLTEILSDPLKALETNKKLRNAVAAKGKQMGWNLFPSNSVTSNQIVAHNSDSKVPSTDLGEIKLNEKIKIHQSGDATDTFNILMFGKSGCGQTTLLSYLTENNQLIGTDSMSTQQFSAQTFQLPSDTGMTKIYINESPGMCSGFEIKELQQHWNNSISRVNKEGGVSVFLLLIKSNERITSQFIDEIEEFSELYFDEREELWKRTVVVFTSIDELKGCNSLEDSVNKLETQIAKPGMEKVKSVLDQTSTRCIYVSSIDLLDRHRVVTDLNDRLQSIEPGEQRICKQQGLLKEIFHELSDILPFSEGDQTAVPHRRSAEVNNDTDEDISDFQESNSHQVSVIDQPNDSNTNSKPTHLLTNKNNTIYLKENQPCDSMSDIKYPTTTSKSTSEFSQKSSTNIPPNNTYSQEQIDSVSDKQRSDRPDLMQHSNFNEKNGSKQSNSPPCIKNTKTTSDKPSCHSVYPDKAICPPSQKYDSKSKKRDTSHYPNNTTSSSHVNVHVSKEEIEKKEPSIQNKATQTQHGANVNLIDTQNAATPPSMNRIQCKQLNSEWLKQLENNDSTVLKQLTHDNLLELIFKMYQDNQGKECIINAYKQLSSD